MALKSVQLDLISGMEMVVSYDEESKTLRRNYRPEEAHEVIASLVVALYEARNNTNSTIQPWVHSLPRMQQAVLLGGLRGPDGVPKLHDSKWAVRWYRRCVLITAFDGRILTDPYEEGGGDYTGPVPAGFHHYELFLSSMDALPVHHILHFMWGAEILGYRHPDKMIASGWLAFYVRWCRKLHVKPETMEELDARLGDNETAWRSKS